VSTLADIPEDFIELLPKTAAEPEDGPIYFLWVFDPHNDKVIIEHNEGRHPANHVDHRDLAEKVPHPERIHGYAYRIKSGWRITDYEHKPVDDSHVFHLVHQGLNKLKLKDQ
jgi:hypothetical protein